MKSYHHLVRHSGNRDLFRAVEMSILAMMNGVTFHLHAEGLRGTGKTSIIRAAKDILPPIMRVKNCIYNCHPDYPHCPEHKNLQRYQIDLLGIEQVPCPFLEISHAAKVGTVVGSIDLVKLTDKMNPVAAVLPGTIPQANRGIIFIDEINRLADTSPEIADVLLSVMGTKPGKVQIEESGLPTVDIPVSVTVWAASNPDEEPGGLTQIRRQLADRFDMAVPMGRPNDYKAVSMILKENSSELHTQVDFGFLDTNLGCIQSEERIKNVLANIYVDYGLESLRAVEAMDIGSRLNAKLSGRSAIQTSDIIAIVPLVLGHRTDSGSITGILKYLESLDTESINIRHREENNNLIRNAEQYQTPAAAVSLVERLWKQIKNLFHNPNRSAPNGKGTRNQTESSHSGDRMSGGPQHAPADPMQTDINAPEKTAVPLSKLKMDEYVSEGNTPPHGR